MNKKLFAILLATTILSINVIAQRGHQDEEEKKFFKKENLFTGGAVNAQFYSGGLTLGLGPYFGYSLNKFVDVAAALNYNYVSQRDTNSTLKYRQSIIGPGAFIRLFPIKGIYFQGQYEYNFLKQKAIYGVAGYPDEVLKLKSQSILVGGGYATGRDPSEKSPYYFFSILVDVGKSDFSPYRDNFGRKTPIIRAGMHFPLFQNKN